MRYIIIGLGIYGENLARDLTALGHEVIGADRVQSHVDTLKDSISAVYLIDSTEQSQLEVLPLLKVDLVVVAIGENFGASIKTVALLKQAGVKHIYARAIDSLHHAILESFGIDRIITPEQRAAFDLSHELQLGGAVQTLEVDADSLVASFDVPDFFLGISYPELGRRLSKDYGVTLVAVARPRERTNVLGLKRPTLASLPIDSDPAPVAEHADRITIFGSRRRLRDICRHA